MLYRRSWRRLIFPIIVRTHRVPFYAARACAKSARTDLSPLPRRAMAAIVTWIMSAAKIMSMSREDLIRSLREALTQRQGRGCRRRSCARHLARGAQEAAAHGGPDRAPDEQEPDRLPEVEAGNALGRRRPGNIAAGDPDAAGGRWALPSP